MNPIQQEIIDRIVKYGSVVVSCPSGLYSRFGTPIAYACNKEWPLRSNKSREDFLTKYFIPFSKLESKKIIKQQTRNLYRYERLARLQLKQWKFSEVKKTTEAAASLMKDMDAKYEYYHLKGGLSNEHKN
jgi:predicted amidophosphoribosyltransferase